MRYVSDTGAFVYVRAAPRPRARPPAAWNGGACPGDPGRASPPNCVQDVETDIPGPEGPALWHH